MKPLYLRRWILICALLVSPMALAGITDLGDQLGTKLMQDDFYFGSMVVTCMAYEMGDQFLYTYDLINPQDSAEKASWFSVAIQSGVDILSVGYDTSNTLIVPAVWHDVGDPIISVDAHFQNPLTSGDVSTTLYYFSAQGPSTTTASIGGSTETGQGFMYVESITSPVPEPATCLLLGVGGCLCGVARRKRK